MFTLINAYPEGNAEVWYMKPTTFDAVYTNGLRTVAIDPANLAFTHVKLGTIEAEDLEDVFAMMQGERWSPNGEARDFIRSLGLHHTSMSVGDIVNLNGKVWQVESFGWRNVN